MTRDDLLNTQFNFNFIFHEMNHMGIFGGF